jgi:hypothetical protein
MGNIKSLAHQIINGTWYVILANITAGNQSLLLYCETDAIWLHSDEINKIPLIVGVEKLRN